MISELEGSHHQLRELVVTDDERERARCAVARHASSREDYVWLLEALGLPSAKEQQVDDQQ